MNVEINPAADLALRKQVERVVRPVRAGRDRKLRMREELLGHVTEIYAEELRRQPDERAAVAAALQRFGDPASLTAELDASVGLTGRFAYYDSALSQCFCPISGESLLRFALRFLLAMGTANFVLIVAAALFDGLVIGMWGHDSSKLPLLPNVFLLLTAGEVATVVAAWSIARTLSRDHRLSRWFWAVVLAMLWTLVDLAIVALFWWSITGTFAGFQRIAGRAAVWGIAGLAAAWGPLPVVLLVSAWVLHRGRKYRQKYEIWTTLAIDE